MSTPVYSSVYGDAVYDDALIVPDVYGEGTLEAAAGDANASAELASGTGSAFGASASLAPESGAGAGTGDAGSPTVTVGAAGGSGSGSGASGGPSSSVEASAGAASGTGTSYDATVSTDVFTNADAGLASGTGTSYGASIALEGSSGSGGGTGSSGGPSASVSASAEVASGTGSAYDGAASLAGSSGSASGSGSSGAPAPSVAASGGHASGTGLSFDATVSTSTSTNADAGLASGSGSALGPTVFLSGSAGSGGGTGTSGGASSRVSASAQSAGGSGSALASTIVIYPHTYANAETAHGSGSTVASGGSTGSGVGSGGAGATEGSGALPPTVATDGLTSGSDDYQGLSKAIHSDTWDSATEPTGQVDQDDELYMGTGPKITSHEDSPAQWDDSTIDGGLFENDLGVYYRGRSEAIHVYGVPVVLDPPEPVPACKCCEEQGSEDPHASGDCSDPEGGCFTDDFQRSVASGSSDGNGTTADVDDGQFYGVSSMGTAWDVRRSSEQDVVETYVDGQGARAVIHQETNGFAGWVRSTLPATVVAATEEARTMQFTLMAVPPPEGGGSTDYACRVIFDGLSIGLGSGLGSVVSGRLSGAFYACMNLSPTGSDFTPNESQIGFTGATWPSSGSYGVAHVAVDPGFWGVGVTYTMTIEHQLNTPSAGQTTVTGTITDGVSTYQTSTVFGDLTGWTINKPGFAVQRSLSYGSSFAGAWDVRVEEIHIPELETCCGEGPIEGPCTLEETFSRSNTTSPDLGVTPWGEAWGAIASSTQASLNIVSQQARFFIEGRTNFGTRLAVASLPDTLSYSVRFDMHVTSWDDVTTNLANASFSWRQRNFAAGFLSDLATGQTLRLTITPVFAIVSTAFTLTPGTTYHVLWEIEPGVGHRIKVYTGAEPGSWTLEQNDTQAESGTNDLQWVASNSISTTAPGQIAPEVDVLVDDIQLESTCLEPGGGECGCVECEDPDNPGFQIPPFTPGYLPTFRRQIGDPTTSLDAFICTLESAAMVLDWHTRGAVKVWGGELIPWTGRSEASIYGSGSNLGDAQQAWMHWGQHLDIRSGQTWNDLMEALSEGRAVILQGDYGEFSLNERCQDDFVDNHAISVYPYQQSGRLLVGDPICHDFKGFLESSLQAYAEALGQAVYGTTSPQKILFAVSRPWAP